MAHGRQSPHQPYGFQILSGWLNSSAMKRTKSWKFGAPAEARKDCQMLMAAFTATVDMVVHSTAHHEAEQSDIRRRPPTRSARRAGPSRVQQLQVQDRCKRLACAPWRMPKVRCLGHCDYRRGLNREYSRRISNCAGCTYRAHDRRHCG